MANGYRGLWRRLLRRRGLRMRFRTAWPGRGSRREPHRADFDEEEKGRGQGYAARSRVTDYDAARPKATGGSPSDAVDYDDLGTAPEPSEGKPEPTPKRLRAALFDIFDEMKEQEEEHLADGRPRVENVNDRLRIKGISQYVSRAEIDEAYEAWQKPGPS